MPCASSVTHRPVSQRPGRVVDQRIDPLTASMHCTSPPWLQATTNRDVPCVVCKCKSAGVASTQARKGIRQRRSSEAPGVGWLDCRMDWDGTVCLCALCVTRQCAGALLESVHMQGHHHHHLQMNLYTRNLQIGTSSCNGTHTIAGRAGVARGRVQAFCVPDTVFAGHAQDALMQSQQGPCRPA